MNHFWSHPVGVSHHRVSLPPVRLLHAMDLQVLLVLVLHHQPSQTEVRHHHTVILRTDVLKLEYIHKKHTRTSISVYSFMHFLEPLDPC